MMTSPSEWGCLDTLARDIAKGQAEINRRIAGMTGQLDHYKATGVATLSESHREPLPPLYRPEPYMNWSQQCRVARSPNSSRTNSAE
jgi:hypothetical protein